MRNAYAFLSIMIGVITSSAAVMPLVKGNTWLYSHEYTIQYTHQVYINSKTIITIVDSSKVFTDTLGIRIDSVRIGRDSTFVQFFLWSSIRNNPGYPAKPEVVIFKDSAYTKNTVNSFTQRTSTADFWLNPDWLFPFSAYPRSIDSVTGSTDTIIAGKKYELYTAIGIISLQEPSYGVNIYQKSVLRYIENYGYISLTESFTESGSAPPSTRWNLISFTGTGSNVILALGKRPIYSIADHRTTTVFRIAAGSKNAHPFHGFNLAGKKMYSLQSPSCYVAAYPLLGKDRSFGAGRVCQDGKDGKEHHH